MPSPENQPVDTTDVHVNLRRINEQLVVTSVEQQELAEARERERAELNHVLEALSEGVVIAEREGRLVLVNAAARVLLGGEGTGAFSVASLEAIGLRSLQGERLPLERHPLRRAMNGEVFADQELLLDRAGRAPRTVIVNGSTIQGADGAALAMLEWRDVTERRNLEARLAQAERLATLGTLTAGVAHEIHNPLAYVVGNLDFALASLPSLRSEIGDPREVAAEAVASRLCDLEEALADAREGCARVHGIVSALGGFGGQYAPERAEVDVRDVLEGALRLTDSQVRLCARVRRDYRSIPRVLVNGHQLAQIFTNLLINAAQAIGEGLADRNHIDVATFTDGAGQPVVELSDSGPGMAPEVLERIFEPFFTTKVAGQGSGLGLAICRSIAASVGAELSARSKLGEGTTFRLVLRACAVRSSVAPTSDSPAATVVAGRRGSVLIIDDEAAIGRVFCRLLEAEHDVVFLLDAREALGRIAAEERFDIILCDLMMPSMTGMEFYETLAAQYPDQARKVVLMSGGAFGDAAQNFVRSFPKRALSKPIDRDVLLGIVSEYVRLSLAQPPEEHALLSFPAP